MPSGYEAVVQCQADKDTRTNGDKQANENIPTNRDIPGS